MKDKKQVNLKNILDEFEMSVQTFIAAPTKLNMKQIINVGNDYQDLWIENISNASGPSESRDFTQFLTKESESELGERLKNSSGDPSELEAIAGEYLAEADYRKPIIMADRQRSMEMTKPELIETSISKDKKTKLLTYKGVAPEIFSLNEEEGGNILIPQQAYNYHALRAIRPSKKTTNKETNRRWYIERNSESEIREPWWSERDAFHGLLEDAASKKVLDHTKNDSRLGRLVPEIRFINSDELERAEQDSFLKTFTTSVEEFKKFQQPNFYFVIAESVLPKKYKYKVLDDGSFEPHNSVITSIDKFDQDFKNLEPQKWRDIMIYSPEAITLRSVTNDLGHKPKVAIATNDAWVISNDMCMLSNQALRGFISKLHPELYKELNEQDKSIGAFEV